MNWNGNRNMRLYNSKTGKVELFQPMDEKLVKMYVCGPTVYNHAHIGNARPIVVFDTLARVIRANGYDLHYVSNFTDVDDKIINKAIDEGVDEKVISTRYIDAYNALRNQLQCEALYATPKVTDTMDEIISYIDDLVKSGNAYNVNGNVYFDVLKCPSYGCVSRQNLADLEAGARIETSDEKHSPYDFVLWKKTDKGIQWDSPWGKGRPGWHTECVVMIQDNLGGQVDIHGGGADLRFPHHENEQAQCVCHSNHDLANYWVHNAMINLDGVKMSKSLGNILWAKDIVAQLGANLFRWIILSTHYRGTLNFSEEVVESSRKELDKITTPLRQANLQLQVSGYSSDEYDKDSYDAFLNEMNDDLNTPNAMTVIFDTVKKLNAALRVKEKDNGIISAYFNSINKMLAVLGIFIELPKFTLEQLDLYNQWNQAKANKDFELADTLRAQLVDQHIL